MRQSSGFTLIELMVTVVIVGILAAIAYPSYQRYVVETRRSDAQIALTRTAADLEKFYSECSQYTTSLTGPRKCSDATPGLGYSSIYSPDRYYSLAITSSGISYTITATTFGAQVKDTECKTMTINNKGEKTAANSSGVANTRCWRK